VGLFSLTCRRTGALQLMANRNALGEESSRGSPTWMWAYRRRDRPIFRTRRARSPRSAVVSAVTKSLRPMPEKWHGLKDVETRYRSDTST